RWVAWRGPSISAMRAPFSRRRAPAMSAGSTCSCTAAAKSRPSWMPPTSTKDHEMREAVIVSVARTPIGRAYRGAFNDTEAPVLGGHVVRAVVERAGIDPAEVEDVQLGIAAQQGTQGYNLGRLCVYTGGLPDSVPGMAVDRMCSSGLVTIASVAKGIMV